MNFHKPAQAIIYTTDMEPITAIDMRDWYWEHLYEHGMIQFAIVELPKIFSIEPNAIVEYSPRQIRVNANYINYRNGTPSFFLLTVDDEVTALLLDAAILPGQRKVFNEEKKKAFAKGVMKALSLGVGK